MGYIGYVLLGVIVLLGIWIFIGSKKKKWYKVYLANNDVMLLRRDLKERWFRTSDRYMRFTDEFGREFTFPAGAHWILFWEEIPEGEVEVVRDEIKRIKEAQAERVKANEY